MTSSVRLPPPATLPTCATLTAAFERCTASQETGVALVDRGEQSTRRTWSEIGDAALGVAGGLQALGIQPGARIGLVFPTSFAFVEAFFGCLLAGLVPVPLYPPVRLGRLDEYHRRTSAMLKAVDADLLLCDTRVRKILGTTVEALQPRHGCRSIPELPSGRPEAHRAAPRDLCLIQFSSGTTFEPKPVALSHAAVMAQVSALNSFWPDTDDVRHSGVSWLPLYHDMGLIGCLFTAIERPGDLTLIPPELFVARPAIWLRTVSATRATISPAPNFAYGLCVEKVGDDELSGVDLSNWRIALNGAETVVGEVARSFCQRFSAWGFQPQAMTPVYGLSEAALAVTFSTLDEGLSSRRFSRRALALEGTALEDPDGVEIVSLGEPLQGVEISIRNDLGSEVAETQTGNVWVRSTSLMSGYFANEDATAKVMRNGWLDTGDVGFIHSGELYLTGRAKDVLILRGRNHLPHDVEHAIDGLPEVRTGCSAALSYLPEGERTEVLLVLVERARQVKRTEFSDLVSSCRRRILARTGLDATQIEILEPGTLPRTSSGKIRRQTALARFLDGRLSPPKPVNPVRLLGEMARSHIALRRSRASSTKNRS